MAAAARLYKGGKAEEVEAATRTYYGACIAQMTTPKNGLKALDTFWRETLPATLQQRAAQEGGAYVTKEELYRIMRWKITRGKSRPLLHLIQSNDDAAIRRVSKAAFAALDGDGKKANEDDDEAAAAARVQRAVEILSAPEVKGVGPATSSAVLAAYRGNLAPFMADEAAAAAGMPKLKYSLQEYMEFRRRLVAKAKALGGGVAAEALGRALWALSKAEALGLVRADSKATKDAGEAAATAAAATASSSSGAKGAKRERKQGTEGEKTEGKQKTKKARKA